MYFRVTCCLHFRGNTFRAFKTQEADSSESFQTTRHLHLKKQTSATTFRVCFSISFTRLNSAVYHHGNYRNRHDLTVSSKVFDDDKDIDDNNDDDDDVKKKKKKKKKKPVWQLWISNIRTERKLSFTHRMNGSHATYVHKQDDKHTINCLGFKGEMG